MNTTCVYSFNREFDAFSHRIEQCAVVWKTQTCSEVAQEYRGEVGAKSDRMLRKRGLDVD